MRNLLFLGLFSTLVYTSQSQSCFCGDTSNQQNGEPSWLWSLEVRCPKGNFITKCQSTLISDRHVLTARDCAVQKNGQITLYSGSHNRVSHSIKRMTKFKKSNIAIFELMNPLDFNDENTPKPICLPDGKNIEHFESFENFENFELGSLFVDPSGNGKEQHEILDHKSCKRDTGFNASPETHILIKKRKKEQCPVTPFTTLFSKSKSSPSWYATGVLHTEHSKKFCEAGKTKTTVFDRLTYHQTAFEDLLKDAKTCSPKPRECRTNHSNGKAIDFYYSSYARPSQSVRMTIKHLNLSVNYKHVDLSRDKQMNAEFLALNPLHTTPVIVDHDNNDFTLWESRAIMAYLADTFGPSDIYPEDITQRALVNRWLYFDAGSLSPAVTAFMYPAQSGETFYRQAMKDVRDTLQDMETMLKRQTTNYVAGDSVTIADLSILTNITPSVIRTHINLSKYPNIIKWWYNMMKLPYYDEINE